MEILLTAAAPAALLFSFTAKASAQRDMGSLDFHTWRKTQDFYERNDPGDTHGLDRDRDGIACEALR